jgi:hypothetical protein
MIKKQLQTPTTIEFNGEFAARKSRMLDFLEAERS